MLPTVDNWKKAKEYQKHGQDNIEYAKNCLKRSEEYPKEKEFFINHFLKHIDLILFWAKEIEDELG